MKISGREVTPQLMVMHSFLPRPRCLAWRFPPNSLDASIDAQNMTPIEEENQVSAKQRVVLLEAKRPDQEPRRAVYEELNHSPKSSESSGEAKYEEYSGQSFECSSDIKYCYRILCTECC